MRNLFKKLDTACMLLFFLTMGVAPALALFAVWKWETLWFQVLLTDLIVSITLWGFGVTLTALDKKIN